MSSSRHRHGKSSHSHRSPTPPRYDYYYDGVNADGASSSSSNDYKQLYKEARHDLKRKRRDLEELEKNLELERKETKKAKHDTADLWKIYYTLQQELQQSYERNAKVQSEKATLEAEAEERRKNDEITKAAGADNPEKMREALFAMQKQKIDMQTKFNEIVLENKRLKEKELTYEPRLRELDGMKEKMTDSLAAVKELMAMSASVRAEMREASFSVEEVEKFRRWNSMLLLEVNQKTQKVAHLAAAEEIRPQLAELTKTIGCLREGLQALLADVKQLKLDACGWTGGAIKDTVKDMNKLLLQTRLQFDTFAQRVTRIDGSWVSELQERLALLPTAFSNDNVIKEVAAVLLTLIAEHTQQESSNADAAEAEEQAGADAEQPADELE